MPVRAKYKEEQNIGQSKIQRRANYRKEQNTGQSKIQRRAKYRKEQNTKKSICDESAANGWRAAAPPTHHTIPS